MTSRSGIVSRITVASCVLGAGIGLSISYIVAAPWGAEHSCPYGGPAQPRWACQYPPDQAAWSWHWFWWGLLVGVIFGLALGCLVVMRYQERLESSDEGDAPSHDRRFMRA